MGATHWFGIACTSDGTSGALTKTRLDRAEHASTQTINRVGFNKPAHDDPTQKVPSRVLFDNT